MKLKLKQVKNTTMDRDCGICILREDTCYAVITSCEAGQYFKLTNKKPKKKKKLELTELIIHSFNPRGICTRCGMSKVYYEAFGSDCFNNPMVKILPQRTKKQ